MYPVIAVMIHARREVNIAPTLSKPVRNFQQPQNAARRFENYSPWRTMNGTSASGTNHKMLMPAPTFLHAIH